MLWACFLCLIRMAMAMAWPPEKPAGENPQPVTESVTGEPRGRLAHCDMHNENVMFGDAVPPDEDEEHSLVPIMKLIDFGTAREFTEDEGGMEAIALNIYDIGCLAAELISLNTNKSIDLQHQVASGARRFVMTPGEPEILTAAGFLLPKDNGVDPFPSVDLDLRRVVCACLAKESEDRPELEWLVNYATQAVAERTEEWYKDREHGHRETDQFIHSMLQDLMFNAAY
ncbi:hypothetical protein F5Y17DRAFT_446080 [Xylariaceae sp. FL0594]|nr:hypothetical protein F5Y17DRAFT_446080 [Xylariaceae sp. FL0594]